VGWQLATLEFMKIAIRRQSQKRGALPVGILWKGWQQTILLPGGREAYRFKMTGSAVIAKQREIRISVCLLPFGLSL
jgi:hypothetical protein